MIIPVAAPLFPPRLSRLGFTAATGHGGGDILCGAGLGPVAGGRLNEDEPPPLLVLVLLLGAPAAPVEDSVEDDSVEDSEEVEEVVESDDDV